jgi:hypothetical protein
LNEFINEYDKISCIDVRALICVTRRVAIQFFRVFVFFIVSRTTENQTVNGTAQVSFPAI